MEIEVNELGGNDVKVTLRGRLDSPGVDRIETRFVAALVPRGRNAIVDLSQTEFVASMGVRMFISAARALNDRKARFVLFAPQELVREVFDTVSLGNIIVICENESEALSALKAS